MRSDSLLCIFSEHTSVDEDNAFNSRITDSCNIYVFCCASNCEIVHNYMAFQYNPMTELNYYTSLYEQDRVLGTNFRRNAVVQLDDSLYQFQQANGRSNFVFEHLDQAIQTNGTSHVPLAVSDPCSISSDCHKARRKRLETINRRLCASYCFGEESYESLQVHVEAEHQTNEIDLLRLLASF